MTAESLISLWGPLGLIAVLFVVLLKWVLNTHERTVEAHMAGAEAAKASTAVIERNTDAVNNLSTDIKLLRQNIVAIEKGQKAWSKRSLP